MLLELLIKHIWKGCYAYKNSSTVQIADPWPIQEPEISTFYLFPYLFKEVLVTYWPATVV